MCHVPFQNQNMSLKPSFVRTQINLPLVKLYFILKSIPNYRRVIWNGILLMERVCKTLYIILLTSVKGNSFYIWTQFILKGASLANYFATLSKVTVFFIHCNVTPTLLISFNESGFRRKEILNVRWSLKIFIFRDVKPCRCALMMSAWLSFSSS